MFPVSRNNGNIFGKAPHTIYEYLNIHLINDTYNVTDTLLLYFKNGKSNQHNIFTIATSFSDTNNHVKWEKNIL